LGRSFLGSSVRFGFSAFVEQFVKALPARFLTDSSLPPKQALRPCFRLFTFFEPHIFARKDLIRPGPFFPRSCRSSVDPSWLFTPPTLAQICLLFPQFPPFKRNGWFLFGSGKLQNYFSRPRAGPAVALAGLFVVGPPPSFFPLPCFSSFYFSSWGQKLKPCVGCANAAAGTYPFIHVFLSIRVAQI